MHFAYLEKVCFEDTLIGNARGLYELQLVSYVQPNSILYNLCVHYPDITPFMLFI